MQVEIRLRRLLARHQMDNHGIIQQMANDLGVNRHTIAKLYNNRTPTVSLTLLSQICSWLQAKGVPVNELPGGLFGSGRAALWEAMVRRGGEVTLYQGEYRSTTQPTVSSRWISTSDSIAVGQIVRQLSQPMQGGDPMPPLKFVYVPFRHSPGDPNLDQRLLEKDKEHAGELFSELKNNSKPGTTIIVGSQRVNYLLEFFLADLCGCKPFVTDMDKARLPFFSVYRPTDRNTPSCFGGTFNPYRRRERDLPGLHYINDKGKWSACPWHEERRDAGIVIAVNDYTHNAITLALFGFSGRATESVGRQLVLKENQFWPPTVELKGKDVGIYLCQLSYEATDPSSDLHQGLPKETCVIQPLNDRTIKRLVRS